MYHGILVVWKEAGMTSHDVVFKLRKILKMKKIGHTGTLDPGVEGVLVVCLGQATKLVEFLMDSHKVYQGQVTLGWSTETEDQFGQVVDKKIVDSDLSSTLVDQTMKSFLGEIIQIPPLYSSVKVNGRKLYEYARLGLEVERPRRKAHIFAFDRIGPLSYDPDNDSLSWDFCVDCGKGTYIRTLAVDLGLKLGYPAHMSSLRRLSSSGFNQSQALSLKEIQVMTETGKLDNIIYPLESAVGQFPRIDLSEVEYQEIKHGKVLETNYFKPEISQETCLFYHDELISIYYPHPEKKGLIKPRKMFI